MRLRSSLRSVGIPTWLHIEPDRPDPNRGPVDTPIRAAAPAVAKHDSWTGKPPPAKGSTSLDAGNGRAPNISNGSAVERPTTP